MKKEYDIIIVGSGLYGSVVAYMAHQAGYRCLVVEKRPFTGGNIHDEVNEGINVHLYGPHIFHTGNRYFNMDEAVKSALEQWDMITKIVAM